jgi:hypothetical protein
MRCPLNYADSEDSHLAAAYSGDGGRSVQAWCKPSVVLMPPMKRSP